MISVQNLCYTYPFTATPTIRSLNFEIAKGEIFGFLGPSGAGKSTTQNILTKLLTGYSGEVKVLGKPLHGWSADYYEHVGVASGISVVNANDHERHRHLAGDADCRIGVESLVVNGTVSHPFGIDRPNHGVGAGNFCRQQGARVCIGKGTQSFHDCASHCRIYPVSLAMGFWSVAYLLACPPALGNPLWRTDPWVHLCAWLFGRRRNPCSVAASFCPQRNIDYENQQ